ncbi:hypothetical protein GCM10010495_56440 [Kitasatospora herbaricolor]|nr:hypothetical protein GCM10010495_56440 [Kitasatospora herbaricolor]
MTEVSAGCRSTGCRRRLPAASASGRTAGPGSVRTPAGLAGAAARVLPGTAAGAGGASETAAAHPVSGSGRWAPRVLGPGIVRVPAVRVGASGASAAAAAGRADLPLNGLLTRQRVGDDSGPAGDLGTIGT